jgi:Replication-relaxation
MPIANPAASTHAQEMPCIGGQLLPARTPNDSLSHRPSRISSAQLDHIHDQLTDSDQVVLMFIADLRIATGQQLRRRFYEGQDARAARRTLARLADWRVLERLPRRIGGVRSGSEGFIYVLGVAGARLLARHGQARRRLEAPGDRYINHSLAITELAVRLHEAERHGELDLLAVEAEPSCWRPFIGSAGTRVVLKPDVFVRIGIGAFEDRWFLEVDLATEARGTLQSKAARYVSHMKSGEQQRAHGVYPRVLWIVSTERRREQLLEALSGLPEAHRRLFETALFEQAVDFLAAEARI